MQALNDYEVEEKIHELGFNNSVEFIIYHWHKLPESSKQRMRSVGIMPKVNLN